MGLRGLATTRGKRTKLAEYAVVTVTIIAIIAMAAWLVSQDIATNF